MAARTRFLAGNPRRIVQARVSALLKTRLGPVLDDLEDVASMTGCPVSLLERVLSGVPRAMSPDELETVQRLALLLAWEWGRDGVLVELDTEEVRHADRDVADPVGQD